jgi:PAS domain S-box-containing protein
LAGRLHLKTKHFIAVDDTSDLIYGNGILSTLLDTTPECIKVVARDGRLLKMNCAGLRMIDADCWESVNQACTFDLVAAEHRSLWRDKHLRVCGGETLDWQFDIISLKGTRRHMETHAAPIVLDDGSIAQLAVSSDITARKISEAALQSLNAKLEMKVFERTRALEEALARLTESERGFSLLVESVTDYAIYMLDPSGNVVSWNAGAKRIKGYDADEVIGQHFQRFYSEEDRRLGKPMTGLRTAAKEGRFETEGWRLRKDGSRFWANVIIDAIHSDGRTVGFAKITRDITERRAAESRLRQAQKMEAVGQFTGGAAHDFNNLLMAVLGSLELLRKRLPDDPKVLGLLDTAVQGAKRGASLTQRMLAFARRQELKSEAVELKGLINNASELMERSLGPGIGIELHLPRDELYAVTDATQLETALLNLAINARDAMPGGGSIAVGVRTATIESNHPSGLAAGRYACLSVADHGIGMDEATLARATEPFFTTKGIGKGTGLGLSMVDGLAGQSGGKLMVHSVLGSGTTVEIWLPCVARVDAPMASVVTTHGQRTRSQQQLCVLAVDDDTLVLANIVALLEDLGHRVIAASSALKAMDAFDADPGVDLLITDQAMPVMTGLELIEALRARRPSLPVILATGFAEFPAGVVGSIERLAKPYTQQQLKQAIGSMMDSSR